MGRTPAFCVALMSTGAVASRYAINVAANEERAVAAALAAVRTLPLWEVRSPVPDHTLTAFGSASKQLRGRPLVLDAGCGTGRSTRILGRTLGDADVLGIDRSAVRLSRGEKLKVPVNAIMVRADLVHFWRLAVQAGWIADYQFLFYPNPYPKPCQLKVSVFILHLLLGTIDLPPPCVATLVCTSRVSVLCHAWRACRDPRKLGCVLGRISRRLLCGRRRDGTASGCGHCGTSIRGGERDTRVPCIEF